jgi:molybdopterin/thiamine biosynthesis adenylyltransferase
MDVPDFGNKAVVLGAQILDDLDCPGLNIRWCAEYVTSENMDALVAAGDCVFLACDNHATRKLVSDRCRQLDDVVFISGGNDGVEDGNAGTYGNVQVYVREHGQAQSAALDEFHPEIAKPADTPPSQQNCLQQAAAGVPQLAFVNLAVASAMCNALLRLLTSDAPQPIYDEVALDVVEAMMTPHWLR